MTPRVVALGLGPAGPDLVSPETLRLLREAPCAFLRTSMHPAASVVADLPSFDEVYRSGETLAGVYSEMTRRLLEAAAHHGEVLYAVPGSPLVAERTVELLRERAAAGEIELEVRPALSFVDLAWSRLGIDPLRSGVRLVDGQRFSLQAVGERGPLLVAQCDSLRVLSEIKLAVEDPPSEPVVLLARLGLPDEMVQEIPWDRLDAVEEPDHLTSLWIPQIQAPLAAELQRFAELVAILRRECPWDRQQTHQSLRSHVIEEAYEVVDAIGRLEEPDGYEHLAEELGDLLLQVFLHATIAAETGRFDLADVATGIHEKLYRRHPHVFGDVHVDSPEGVARNWEIIKRQEKGRVGAFDDLDTAQPALLLALEVQRKASRGGMPYPSVESVYAKVSEELAELRAEPSEHELGDLLFTVVGLAAELDLEPESALRSAALRFTERFRVVAELAESEGRALSELDGPAVDRLWEQAKAALGIPRPEGA